ncbi:hypothetical protein SEEH4316_18072 [Salmonella enterica subsp. enterica serovar Heidelberg str. RI-11-014316]|nr:hypothetical protein SEEH4316_18072 [Salmonella enterica subsp. enterica serovar Heidelberg str. RI-11-014316]
MRTFKTRWFNREAKPHTIKDDELSEAINAVLQGKADNLGGGVYKKRTQSKSRSRNRVGKGRRTLVLHLPVCQTGYGQH